MGFNFYCTHGFFTFTVCNRDCKSGAVSQPGAQQTPPSYLAPRPCPRLSLLGKRNERIGILTAPYFNYKVEVQKHGVEFGLAPATRSEYHTRDHRSTLRWPLYG